MAATIRVTYKKSAIGYSQRQKDTIRSLGLKRLGHVVDLPDNTAIRGMVHHVRHLVEMVEVDEADPAPAERADTPSAPPDAGPVTSGGALAGNED